MVAISTAKQDLVSNYKYIVADLVTGNILNEIPFQNVKYTRSLKEAGSFSGDIPVIDGTFNMELYANTLPGKTALFIVRDNICVWGGILWARSYDLASKTLNISGAEFTSYLYHRVLWKTWKNEYEATITLNGSGTATAVLTYDTHTFTVNSPIFISFGSDVNYGKNGYYTITGVTNTTTFSFGTIAGSFTDDACTVTVRQDSYEYMRDLLESLKLDLYSMKFPNTEIEPASNFDQAISSISRSSNVATLVFNEDHYLIPGQRFTLRNVPTSYMTNSLGESNGRHIVISTPSSNSVTFANTGSNSGSTALSPSVSTITYIARGIDGTVTLTTSTTHGISVGDIVTVNNVHGAVDGEWTVTSVPTTTTFSYSTPFAIEIVTSAVGSGATVTRSPSARFASYGEYTLNSGLDISYDPASALSSQNPRVNPLFRGSELRTVGDILDDYSNVPDGFEYRIDCAYNATTGKFDKTFVFLPLKPDSLVTYLNTLPGDVLPVGQYAPPSAFGADQVVFEHPGSILGASMEETAEDAATRFWVQGEDDTGNSDASLPYAGESSIEYIDAGWPILDQVEKVNGVSDEDTLYNYAARYLSESLPPVSHFSVVVNGSVRPEVGSYSPGDWCSVIINNDDFVSLRLQSDLEPGSTQGDRQGMLLRKIDSYEVTVPDNPSFPEQVTLQLVLERAIDTVGVARLDLVVTEVTSTSATFSVLILQENPTTLSATLTKDGTTINTWSVASGGVVQTTYTATGLTSDTSYSFVLNGYNGAKAYQYIRTNV
jgi:hypothetical protein